jgi:membrane glycosyltransferase
MLEIAALTYGALATFVMASVNRNRREERANPPILTMFGLLIMAFSLAMSAILIGYVGYEHLAIV